MSITNSIWVSIGNLHKYGEVMMDSIRVGK